MIFRWIFIGLFGIMGLLSIVTYLVIEDVNENVILLSIAFTLQAIFWNQLGLAEVRKQNDDKRHQELLEKIRETKL